MTCSTKSTITRLKSAVLSTPIGEMYALADAEALYLLDFASSSHLDANIKKLKQKINIEIYPEESTIFVNLQNELNNYFAGSLTEFNTPLKLFGTDFQKKVWQILSRIPYGETRSYAEIAVKVGNPLAYRAVAQANGANLIPLIIPCHRVINADGKMGGYSCGIDRKIWLLDHERNFRLLSKLAF